MGTRKSMPGYDILGNIAIADFEGTGKRREKTIAKKILAAHRNVTTILAKAGPITGRFRIRKLRYVLGKRNYVADYRENGCRFVFDVRKTFFSNRLSFERARVAAMSKRKERVVVMFAGAGPFAIELAKKNPKAEVVAIELNKDAYIYMCENIMLNRVANVTAVLGDVKTVSPRYRGFADRVVMPLPKTSVEFLDDAVACAKRNAVIHAYLMVGRTAAQKEASEILKAHSRELGYRSRMLGWRIVRDYSPDEVEIVVDLKISR